MTLYACLEIIIALGFLILLIGVKAQEAWVKPCLAAAFLIACAFYILKGYMLHSRPWLGEHPKAWRILIGVRGILAGTPVGILFTLLASGKMWPPKKKNSQTSISS